ncbi:MAG: hypothetical protein A2V81_03560 [Candidatus Abawacabacteria bacterium RBG_16_42_10]|uniref:Uncharacterized protein n=1 Tax=Candidatus Abawacabacteria bacterium RBG_16_42_10 TaxID=1817814 RepID=A0A1F4XJV8_9BACT|nr:MAG: hypothetical protein A2V81_03560 [Candidatus Abawacabacteria bacterium RBG_16_42_10]
MADNDFYIGPRKYEGVIVFYRMLAGIVGGLAGGLIILIGLILAGSLLNALADPTAFVSPFAIFMAVSVLFMAGLVGNGLSVFLMSLSDQDKYQNPYRGLLQVAVINIVIFLISIGAYFIARSIDISFMITVALVQFVSSALASTFVFSAVTVRPSEFVIEIYGGFISMLLGLGIATLVYFVGNELALFFGLPIIMWFSIGFFGGLTEFFYYQLYRHTGVDVLETGDADYQDEGFDEPAERKK